jgi:hypothetical protein
MMCHTEWLPYRAPLIAGIVVGLLILTKVLEAVVSRVWTSFELNEMAVKMGDTRETFTRQVALNLIGISVHSFLGPAALYTSLTMATSRTTHLGGLHPMWSETEEQCSTHAQMWVVINAFATLSTFQLCGLFLGWEKGADIWFHHILFTALVWGGQWESWGVGLAGASAVQMEISTPVLLMFMTLRRLVGHESKVAVLKLVFFFLFFASRICIYGYAVVTHVLPWITSPQVLINATGEIGTTVRCAIAVTALYTAGWFLQFYWFVTIAKNAMVVLGCISKRAQKKGKKE